MSSTIRSRIEGPTCILTIHRPTAKNALSRATVRELEDALRHHSEDPSVRCIVLTAEGHDVFVSGGDLKEFAALADELEGVDEVLAMGRSLGMIEQCSVPVIAAVQGNALGGGCELILACDMAVLADHVSLSFRQAAMGLSTGWGGITRLLERVGPSQAARILMCGEPVRATEALSLGLAVDVVAEAALMTRTLELASRIAGFPRDAITGLKQSLWQVRTCQRHDSFARESTVFRSLWGGPSHRAALQSFFGKKSPTQ